jgi:hypothetical protein
LIHSFVGLGLLIVCSLAAGRAQAAPAPAAISFPEGVLPLEQLLAFSWRSVSDDLVPVLRRASGPASPDGSSDLISTSGKTEATLLVSSTLSDDRTSRTVDLHIRAKMGYRSTIFRVLISTWGKDLADVTVEKIRQGALPTYFLGQNETLVEVKLWISDRLETIFRVGRSVSAGSVEKISGEILELNWEDWYTMAYQEVSTPSLRSFKYKVQFNGVDYDSAAKKRQAPGMVMGTSEFFFRGEPVGLGSFQRAFSQTAFFLGKYWRARLRYAACELGSYLQPGPDFDSCYYKFD